MSARNLRRMIAGLRDEGVTVFLTTHYLEEAERLCDRLPSSSRGASSRWTRWHGLKAAAQRKTAVEMTLPVQTATHGNPTHRR